MQELDTWWQARTGAFFLLVCWEYSDVHSSARQNSYYSPKQMFRKMSSWAANADYFHYHHLIGKHSYKVISIKKCNICLCQTVWAGNSGWVSYCRLLCRHECTCALPLSFCDPSFQLVLRWTYNMCFILCLKGKCCRVCAEYVCASSCAEKLNHNRCSWAQCPVVQSPVKAVRTV